MKIAVTAVIGKKDIISIFDADSNYLRDLDVDEAKMLISHLQNAILFIESYTEVTHG